METNSNKEFAGSFLYGYRADECNLKVPDVPDSTSYVVHKNYSEYDNSFRPPMAASFVKNTEAIPPRPDTTNPESLLTGVGKRMAYSPPKYNRNERRRFRKFVRKWVKKNLIPIDESDDLSFEEWLSSTNYPEYRKEEIRKAFPEDCFVNGEVDVEKFKNYDIKIFAKEEYYPEYKHFRGIWARSDAAKGVVGPFFRKIEKELFALPYFIKKIPKNERPEYINNFMNDESLKFQGTDYTSYESHFTTDMMDDCEFELYRHMASKNMKAKMLCRLIFKILASNNIAKHKYFSVKVDAKRMSGEMNTSLGNGFSNLMFLLYACEKYKLKFSGPIIEGDDALIGLNKRIPDEYYINMGLNVKLEFVDDISEGSFCGLVYDPVELVNIRDPRETLCTTTWVTRKYAFCSSKNYYGLLKSKALSLMYEYPGCPIVYNYGRKIFELLNKFEIKFSKDSLYKQQIALDAYNSYVNNKIPYKETGPRTRLLMEKIFNIPVNIQLALEREIESMTLENMSLPTALDIVPDCWKENYKNYVLENKFGNIKSINYPSFKRFENLKIHRIIKFDNMVDFRSDKLIPKEKYYEFKLNKDPILYENYKDRYFEARKRLRLNNLKI